MDEGILFLDEGVLFPDEGILFPDEGILFLDEGILFLDEGVLFPDEGVEPDRELEQLVAQDEGPHGLPPGRVVPERLQEVVLIVDGHHGCRLYPVPGSLACSVRRCRSFGCVPPPGVAAPAGLPVVLSARGAARLAEDRGLAAVPALAEFPGLLPLFLGEAPVVLHALRGLVPSLFVFPAVLACAVSFG